LKDGNSYGNGDLYSDLYFSSWGTLYCVMVVNNDSCWPEDRLIHDRRLVSTTFLWLVVVMDVKMGVRCDGCDDGG
jgi:hypothetical protein